MPEPTPLWLALAIESTRYQMTAATTKALRSVWTADLKKKCKSQTAGEMASLLDAYLAARRRVSGPSKATSSSSSRYLKRTTRLKYRQIDIERVCDFLSDMPDKQSGDLLGKLLKLGLKQHPASASAQLPGGHAGSGQRAAAIHTARRIRHLEKALKLAEASNDPKETALLPPIKETLTLIKEMRERVGRMPFGPSPFGFMDGDFDLFDQALSISD